MQDTIRRFEAEAAWKALLEEAKEEKTRNVVLASHAVARMLDEMDMNVHEYDRAIAHYTEEIERYKRAPEVNNCEMLPVWDSKIRVYEIAVAALEHMKGARHA